MTVQRSGGSGFGKRGAVNLRNQPPPPPIETTTAAAVSGKTLGWIGGGLAAIALAVLVIGGTGGSGGLLGGILGGLLGRHIANRLVTPPATPSATATAPAKPAASATTVQRGGFGSTGMSGFSSGS